MGEYFEEIKSIEVNLELIEIDLDFQNLKVLEEKEKPYDEQGF